ETRTRQVPPQGPAQQAVPGHVRRRGSEGEHRSGKPYCAEPAPQPVRLRSRLRPHPARKRLSTGFAVAAHVAKSAPRRAGRGALLLGEGRDPHTRVFPPANPLDRPQTPSPPTRQGRAPPPRQKPPPPFLRPLPCNFAGPPLPPQPQKIRPQPHPPVTPCQ